jgi:adenylate cyclase
VGTTAPGLQDLRSTPVNPVYPGVEIHANLITGMLDGTIKQKPPYVLGAEVLLLGTAGIAMAVALPLLTPLWATVVSALTLLVVAGLNLLVWTQANLVLPLASGLLAVFGIWALNMVYGYFVEARAKRQIAARFGEYVPPEIVDELARNPGLSSSMESIERNLTILFSDVRGFTKISESLDARNLSALMNEYLTPMTRAVHVTRGTIDKYIGDAIVAFWGAPLEDASHASHAVQAGLDMQRRLSEMNEDFSARGWPRLAVGIGLNTGRVRVGNMGSEVRVAYTVMGDAVNLASRLESLTKHYGVSMLVGEATRAAAPEFVYREIDRVRVVGREEPVTIFEPLGRQGEVPQEVLSRMKLFQQALKFYRAQDWDKAELQFLNLSKTETETRLCQVFVTRIGQLRAQRPAPDWDGVHRLDLK